MNLSLKHKFIAGVLGGFLFHRLIPDPRQRQSIYGGLWLGMTLWAMAKVAIGLFLLIAPFVLFALSGTAFALIAIAVALLVSLNKLGTRGVAFVMPLYRATHACWPLSLGCLPVPRKVQGKLQQHGWVALPGSFAVLMLSLVLLPLGLLAFALGANV